MLVTGNSNRLEWETSMQTSEVVNVLLNMMMMLKLGLQITYHRVELVCSKV